MHGYKCYNSLVLSPSFKKKGKHTHTHTHTHTRYFKVFLTFQRCYKRETDFSREKERKIGKMIHWISEENPVLIISKKFTTLEKVRVRTIKAPIVSTAMTAVCHTAV